MRLMCLPLLVCAYAALLRDDDARIGRLVGMAMTMRHQQCTGQDVEMRRQGTDNVSQVHSSHDTSLAPAPQGSSPKATAANKQPGKDCQRCC